MNRRHFIGQSAAALGLLSGFSGQARANLQKAEILVIGWLWWRNSCEVLTSFFKQHRKCHANRTQRLFCIMPPL